MSHPGGCGLEMGRWRGGRRAAGAGSRGRLAVGLVALGLLWGVALDSVAAASEGERTALAVQQAAPATSSPGVPDLAGRWAQKQVTTSVTRVPVVGEVRSRTETLLLVDIVQRGADLELTTEVCAISIRNRPNLVRTTIPDAFVRSLERTVRMARLTIGAEGWQFEQPRFVEVLGARLDDAERDPLPTSDDDPRVFDQDGSGHPGLTVRIGGMVSGDVYVVQRGWNRLRGRPTGTDRLDGTVEWDNEQVVLGASNVFLRRDSPAEPDGARGRNWFRSTRVAPGTTCREVVRTADGLFAR